MDRSGRCSVSKITASRAGADMDKARKKHCTRKASICLRIYASRRYKVLTRRHKAKKTRQRAGLGTFTGNPTTLRLRRSIVRSEFHHLIAIAMWNISAIFSGWALEGALLVAVRGGCVQCVAAWPLQTFYFDVNQHSNKRMDRLQL